jgi:hypothetical protein
MLRLGLELMRQYRPQEAALLDVWKHRLPELNDRLAAVAKGQRDLLPGPVHEAALLAGCAGNRLKREKEARPVSVPSRFSRQEKEIQRVQARFYAVKQGELFSREMLLALPPKRVEAALEEVRRAGLANEGPAWALKQREMAAAIKHLSALRKDLERGQGLG